MALSQPVTRLLHITMAVAVFFTFYGTAKFLITKSREKNMVDLLAIHEHYLTYYEQVETGKEDFTVTAVLFREDANFLQGFYYDAEMETFYESTGLVGESYVQRLERKRYVIVDPEAEAAEAAA